MVARAFCGSSLNSEGILRAMPFDAQQTLTHLHNLIALRGSEAQQPTRLAEVKAWQAKRLAATYADLQQSARYTKATGFFLSDLYGDADHTQRDRDLLRVFPIMVKLLPEAGVATAAKAIEVDELSEVLDQRVAQLIADGDVTEQTYCAAYRAAGTPVERERQIQLIGEVGERLDALVSNVWIYNTLKLMRGPAKAAGLGELQSFLERGAESFKSMKGATEFLETIEARERKIASQIFSSQRSPLLW
jgi:hypothetical protein